MEIEYLLELTLILISLEGNDTVTQYLFCRTEVSLIRFLGTTYYFEV
jgi:hypothetical protein